jgi:hypothetical protein
VGRCSGCSQPWSLPISRAALVTSIYAAQSSSSCTRSASFGRRDGSGTVAMAKCLSRGISIDTDRHGQNTVFHRTISAARSLSVASIASPGGFRLRWRQRTDRTPRWTTLMWRKTISPGPLPCIGSSQLVGRQGRLSRQDHYHVPDHTVVGLVLSRHDLPRSTQVRSAS